LKIYLSRVEIYRNALVTERESVSIMTKMSKIFKVVNSLMILKGNWWEFSCRNSINWSNKLRIRENVVIHAVNQIVGQYLFQMFGTLVSSTNETDRHDITEILLKVALNTITPTPDQGCIWDIQMYVLAQMCGVLEVLKCICPEC
jgi:hypothetical protein